MPHVVAPGIDLQSIIHRSITPYKPEGWRQALSSAGLTHSFPHLVHDIIYGSPISNPPPLTYTFIPANLKSADIDPIYMDNFIKEEVAAGRFDGPFSVQEARIVFGGHFRTAPLGFIEKPGSSTLRFIYHHLKEDSFSHSTNSWLDPSIGSTKFYLAADAADFVSSGSQVSFVLSTIPTQFHTHSQPRSFLTHQVSTPPIIISFDVCHGGSGFFIPVYKHPGPRGLALTTADDQAQ